MVQLSQILMDFHNFCQNKKKIVYWLLKSLLFAVLEYKILGLLKAKK